MKKRIILLILLIIWSSIIFYFSNQNSISSTKQSDVIINDGIIKTVRIFNRNLSEEEQNEIYINLFTIVRKNAHIFEYFILGLLSFLFINTFEIKYSKKIIIALIYCFLYAISDEIHQLFIPGRSSEIIDVFIDTIGVSLALLIIHLYIIHKNKYLQQN